MGIAAKPRQACIRLLFLIDFCCDKLELMLRGVPQAANAAEAEQLETATADCAASATAQSS